MCLLLQRLLLLGVGEPDLDLELFAGRRDGMVVEDLDDLIACIARVEAVPLSARACQSMLRVCIPSKANATTVAILVSKYTRGAYIVRSEQLCELMLVH